MDRVDPKRCDHAAIEIRMHHGARCHKCGALADFDPQCPGYAGDPGASAPRCESYRDHPGPHFIRRFNA